MWRLNSLSISIFWGKELGDECSVNWIALCNALKHDPIMPFMNVQWNYVFIAPLFSMHAMNLLKWIQYCSTFSFCFLLHTSCFLLSLGSNLFVSLVACLFFLFLLVACHGVFGTMDRALFPILLIAPKCQYERYVFFSYYYLLFAIEIYGLLKMRSLWLKWICHIFDEKCIGLSSILITISTNFNMHWCIGAPVCIAQITCKYSNEFPLCEQEQKLLVGE